MSEQMIMVLINAGSAILAAAALALAFYVKSTAADVAQKKVDALRISVDADIKANTAGLYGRLNALGDRVQIMETRVDDTAKRDDLFKLSLQLAELAGDLKTMNAKMGSLDESSKQNGEALKRVENHIFKIGHQ